MEPYHKIETLLNRDPETFMVTKWDWRTPEFAYLAESEWLWTEKVDGTNIRVMWDGNTVRFAGKSDNAQIHAGLFAVLTGALPDWALDDVFGADGGCLYGEGYGAKIQKGGGNYKTDGQDLVLFDVKVGDWWLKRKDVEDVAGRLGVKVVPVIDHGPLVGAVNLAQRGFQSDWGAFDAEGLVVRPAVPLCARDGSRVIGKIKARDFVKGKR